MEITLEKIELVKDRTGVSYREAKEALEAADGNVVDAIIKIEDEINAKVGAKITDGGAKIVEKIKEAVKKGNVSRITVKKEDEIVLNIPVTAGVVGTVLAPWLTVIGSIIALGMKCEILLVKDDGSVVDLSSKVTETADEVKEKGSEVASTVRNRVVDTVDAVKGKGNEAAGAVQDKVADTAKAVKNTKKKVKEDVDEIKDIVAEAAQEIKETVSGSKE